MYTVTVIPSNPHCGDEAYLSSRSKRSLSTDKRNAVHFDSPTQAVRVANRLKLSRVGYVGVHIFDR